MSKTRKRGLNRVAAVLAAAAAAATAIAAGAPASHPLPPAHHALADDGVVSSRN
jgi:hypothetical protein